MIADIRAHLARTPFVPFTLRMADGQVYSVPTRDHIWLPPRAGRVFVADDQGFATMLPTVLITGLTVPAESADGSSEVTSS